jgi:hypothetical protein
VFAFGVVFILGAAVNDKVIGRQMCQGPSAALAAASLLAPPGVPRLWPQMGSSDFWTEVTSGHFGVDGSSG